MAPIAASFRNGTISASSGSTRGTGTPVSTTRGAAGSAPRRASITVNAWVITASPRSFSRVSRQTAKPRSGFEAEARVSATRRVAESESPGSTGFNQRSSAMPGDPSEECPPIGPACSSRIPREAVCQPDAISRPAKVFSASRSSRWNGCASNSRAKATMSSRLTVSRAPPRTWPAAKSSK